MHVHAWKDQNPPEAEAWPMAVPQAACSLCLLVKGRWAPHGTGQTRGASSLALAAEARLEASLPARVYAVAEPLEMASPDTLRRLLPNAFPA